MSCSSNSSKRKASEALQDYIPESELYTKRFCHDLSNVFPSESRWSSSQSSQESMFDSSCDEMFGHSMSTTPATTEATTPSDSSCRFSTWGREEELRTALESALINDFGPSPQGLPAREQQEEDEFWEGRGVTTVWWQADSGLWFKKPEVCLEFNTIDWSGTGSQQDKGASGAWRSESMEIAPCERRTRIKLSRRKCS
jgi:hypothetical protein